jgi:hypothetical protein
MIQFHSWFESIHVFTVNFLFSSHFSSHLSLHLRCLLKCFTENILMIVLNLIVLLVTVQLQVFWISGIAFPTSSIGVFLPMLHRCILQFLFRFSKCFIVNWICAIGLVEVLHMPIQYSVAIYCCWLDLRLLMEHYSMLLNGAFF